MVPEREKQIGARLRAFREALQIPRSKFAVKIGVGSERLASYEAGRARLKYRVFKTISVEYGINPVWLAEEKCGPGGSGFGPIHDEHFIDAIGPHALFSEVYDNHLAADLLKQAEAEEVFFKGGIELLNRLITAVRNESTPLAHRERMVSLISPGIKKLLELMESEGVMRRKAADRLLENRLTSTSEFRKDSADMKSVPSLSQLLDQVRELTKPRGTKAKLAADLGVPQSRVSEWLSGKYEPSGEIALRLFDWVNSRKRQHK